MVYSAGLISSFYHIISICLELWRYKLPQLQISCLLWIHMKRKTWKQNPPPADAGLVDSTGLLT